MIIAKIIGGLGNQMFQYAAARALALRHNTELALDTSEFDHYKLHQGFELTRVFSVPAKIASRSDLRTVLGWRHSALFRGLADRVPLMRRKSSPLVKEPHFHYWPGYEALPAASYLSGYWQSEQYFRFFESTIRTDFSFKINFNAMNSRLADSIAATTAVSLHVRRGDYASNPKTTAMHGLCGLTYYEDAIRYIAERVTQPHVFIFSDDLPWVKQNLPISLAHTFVGFNTGPEGYNDMHLMSRCRHHIIANSSFSWWGAWLNSRSDKIVVAPRNWFAKPVDTSNLFPINWCLL